MKKNLNFVSVRPEIFQFPKQSKFKVVKILGSTEQPLNDGTDGSRTLFQLGCVPEDSELQKQCFEKGLLPIFNSLQEIDINTIGVVTVDDKGARGAKRYLFNPVTSEGFELEIKEAKAGN